MTKAQAEKSLATIKSACFKCDTHSSDCPIGKAAGAVAAMLDEKNASVKDLIHDQIAGALAGAKFPIKTPTALLEAFPNGA
ncbi:MAG: MTH865 family protein, partial [Methanoregula sp.]|nr:MTH865 family protein [Methanoregula sp.]